MSAVLVLGAERSGVSVSKLAKRLGFHVTLSDIRPIEDFKFLMPTLKECNISYYFGGHPSLNTFDFVIVSPGIPMSAPIMLEAKKRKLPILGEVEFAYQHTKANIVAVTGTNGKTTTVTLLHHIAKEYLSSYLLGNVGTPFSENADTYTAEDVVILELSSFQLESIDSFRAHIACLLNITPDHLNRHTNMETYSYIKKRIFENQQQNDMAIINFDDPLSMEITSSGILASPYYVSLTPLPKNLKGAYVKDNMLLLRTNQKDLPILSVDDILIKGKHNIQNVLAALLMATMMEIPLSHIKKQVKSFSGISHRLEKIAVIEDVTYYNDSKATNPEAAMQALLAIDEPIVLLAGGQTKDTPFDEWMKIFPKKVKHLILFGEAKDILKENAEKYFHGAIDIAPTLEEAVYMAKEVAIKGDVVLLSPACTSYDAFNNFEERGKAFVDAVKY